jgi:DNA primase
MSQQLVSLLSKVIGNQGRKLKKENQYAFYCPECNHYKRKLQVNIEHGKFHCWVCNFGGYNLFQLFKKLEATPAQIEELGTHVKIEKYQPKVDSTKPKVVRLPSDFKPVSVKSDSIFYKHVIKELKKRKLTPHDILRYNIGYCEAGEYSNRIIVPSYDDNGKLNFFVGREVFDSGMKYKNSFTPKDIIGFELFINWDEPIFLIEGAFDAMAIKRNAIPLFGTVILSKLKKMIITKNVKTIYLCLDPDAWERSLDIIKEFLNAGIDIYNVELSEKDPSELGFKTMLSLTETTPKVTFSDLIRYKIKWQSKKKLGNTLMLDEFTSPESAS